MVGFCEGIDESSGFSSYRYIPVIEDERSMFIGDLCTQLRREVRWVFTGPHGGKDENEESFIKVDSRLNAD